MSLKTRLRVSIITLVVALVAALSALALQSVATAKFEDLADRATTTALNVQTLLVQYLSSEDAFLPPASTVEEARRQWTELMERDPRLPALLNDLLAASRTVVEIQVADDAGRVLASSNPASAGKTAASVQSLSSWAQQNSWRQIAAVFRGREDLAVVLPVGAEDMTFFRIRVLFSTVLLRNTLTPLVQWLAGALSVSLLAAVLLAMLVSNLALRPLERVREAIDTIARGDSPLARPAGKGQPEELAALESKLEVLGQQFRGARQDAVELRGNIEQLLERLEEAVLLFDHNNKLIMAGRSAETLLGTGRWELLGRSFEDLFPASTELGAAVSGAVGLRQPLKDSLITLTRNGQAHLRLLVNVEFLEAFPGRERLGTLVTLRDLESRRQIGTHLDVSTRLAAISRLTGGVAHEIKNPLNSIALHLEVLRAKLEGQGSLEEPGSEVEQEIGVISNEITRLDRVVQTFLDFTRPVDLHLADLDASKLAAGIANLVGPEASARGIEIVLDTPAPVVLSADKDLLQQALLNVVMNAVEAMRNGGRLEISVRRSGAECAIRITDHGAGIPESVRDKIFNLYFTTKGKGSGIGLAMTFRVVQLHNGTIDFTSEAGKGTTFWLRLPVRQAEVFAEPENTK
ncbi:MAG: hypothetical protein IT159_05070 [Bryobacterales bacterium]|nr:hypothetical protein [Bryobacterales bacterium]